MALAPPPPRRSRGRTDDMIQINPHRPHQRNNRSKTTHPLFIGCALLHCGISDFIKQIWSGHRHSSDWLHGINEEAWSAYSALQLVPAITVDFCWQPIKQNSTEAALAHASIADADNETGDTINSQSQKGGTPTCVSFFDEIMKRDSPLQYQLNDSLYLLLIAIIPKSIERNTLKVCELTHYTTMQAISR